MTGKKTVRVVENAKKMVRKKEKEKRKNKRKEISTENQKTAKKTLDIVILNEG